MQRADTLQFDSAHNQLILSARFVNREVALDEEFLAILQDLAVGVRFATKQNTVQLSVRILEREVNVAGTLDAQVRRFARHPDQAKLLFEQALHLRRQLADRQHAPRRFARKQLAEVPLGFGLLAHLIRNELSH